jgi:hypothetical protein
MTAAVPAPRPRGNQVRVVAAVRRARLGQTVFQRDRRFWKIVVRPFAGHVNS